ncbi:anaerobic ribonucleoside-triphosphate reductase activating protein [Patescibacteria group bacterium]|nr:anaerobic ribonucleoside-triphosphate reductase activating protein [Patescibacteria group bacterium]MBU1663234.1 anaerobic ribonucleoside-triphosphate reductase activating protein [Patescibacteria group bacterium]MBU1934363.1 anaerobic ribonucleoside-triphosphate reductase activating protein [Patescibacteria group bacterium]MBU2008065.1 anaerobic ribonucleoside-triphosphate reductase activating protein [Patescibacteria group bacterium]MBU2233886.1 anaerobic ribonucleoside-triphosphate reduct
MIIGGLQKFSLLDYPDRVSAIVFTQGCNFHCQFCYNPMLVWPFQVSKSKYAQEEIIGQQKVHPMINQDDLFVFLRSRAGKLDAVVITGGEPCLQKNLLEFIAKIKKLGFLVKLDTNGSYPEALAKLIKEKLIDYIAMDIKAPEKKYKEVTGVEVDFQKIKKSVRIIMQSELAYEFRTTMVPGLLNKDDIGEMGKIIKDANKWYLQNFKSNIELVGRDLEQQVPYNAWQMKQMAQIGSQYVNKCEVR